MELMETEYWQLIDGKLFSIPEELLKFNPNHDELGRFAEAIGSAGASLSVANELQNFDPNAPIPPSPKNAGGMTSTIWSNWEHGVDGNQYVELYRQYAAEQLGLEVPKSPMAPGGYLNYLTERGFGGSSTETAKGHATAMLNAIANGSPTQPALYRGIVAKPTDVNSQNLIKQLSSLQPGDTIDMPLVSTTRSLGVAAWYAADRVAGASDKVIMKIQPGARGVSVSAKNSYYPADHEVVTSGKFEVVGVTHVNTPYWSRGIFEPRKINFIDGSKPHYEVATYSPKRYTPEQAKVVWDTVQAGKIQSLATDTLKFTNDRNPRANGSPVFSSWTKQEPTGFTVVEVKMVEPHVVQKAIDHGMIFDSLFNDRPFINDDPGAFAKFNPNHDERGRFSTGSGMGAGVATSILERVKANGGLSVNMVDGSEPTTGYMVAKGNTFGATVSATDFYDSTKGPKILADYLKAHKSDLGNGKYYLGLWHNNEDGNVYLDVSQNMQDKATAIHEGAPAQRNQISIWDVVNMVEIPTGGTGVAKQEVGSRGIADKHFGDDGFRDRGLRPEDLGEVSKTQVIYFAPGLKPIFKFNPNHDDLGRFASGNASGASGSTNTSGVPAAHTGAWDEARFTEFDAIKAKQNAGELPTAEEFTNWLNSDMTAPIANYKALVGQMFSYDHIGTNRQTGKPEYIRSNVESITYGFDGEINTLEVTGSLINGKGDYVGDFGRRIYADGNGVPQIKNDILNLNTEYTGTGFGTGFLNHVETYAHALGIQNQYIHAVRLAGQENSGPFVWAKRGYGWDTKGTPSQRMINHDNVLYHLRRVLNQDNPDVYTEAALINIEGRMNKYNDSHPNYPTPHEIAYTGWVPGAKSWAGQSIMGNADWYGVKPVGPSNGRK